VKAPKDPASRAGRIRGKLAFGLGDRLRSAFARGGADVDWDDLEETLIGADLGVVATQEVLDAVRASLRKSKDADPHESLRTALLGALGRADRALVLEPPGTSVGAPIVVVGVNGVGKTTSVGKLAYLLVADGYGVVLAAADTFRAAAADQLVTWGARVGVTVVRSDREGGDPGAVAFEAGERARESGADVVLVDTAGRLHNKRDLMDELGKILRVVSRARPPAEVLLVLDATTGQNGLAQARVFSEVAGVTGVILAKLDGSARGGIVIAIERELGVPVKFVGLGERADDFAPFDPEAFVDGLLA
jgi:fused signal recognition particle receptor